MRPTPTLVALALVVASFAAQAQSQLRIARDAGGQVATIPVPQGASAPAQMVTTWFVPPGKGPFPVVVFSHGRASGESARDGLALGISRSQLRYWLGKGAAVVSPVRPGYGESSGDDLENSGTRHDPDGRCVGTPDFLRTAGAAASTIAATLQWLKSQPWADAGDVLLVGQSVGGMATVAAGAQSLPGVVGVVNFAGGAGGNPERAPGASCDPGQIEAMFAGYGKATTVPSLWLYALNDQYWGPEVPRAWHAAFAAGGSPSTFVQEPAVPDGDGHGLSRHDPALWAPAVDAFLAKLHFLRTR